MSREFLRQMCGINAMSCNYATANSCEECAIFQQLRYSQGAQEKMLADLKMKVGAK